MFPCAWIDPPVSADTMTDRIKVVLADDTLWLRNLVALSLNADGRFEVVAQVDDGEQALEAVEQTEPDLVVMDLSMPNMDGLTAIRSLRLTRPELPVVVLTGFPRKNMASAAFEAGAVAYIEKGEDLSDLADVLLSALGPGAR
jgi:DNA-binding NarL/FixJ family response regulator